jgi:secretion/DNA translocation related TadE-like protein
MRHDRGSVSIWVAAVLALLWLAATAALSYGGAVTGRHRATSAADLAALAAAVHVPDGQEAACAVAATITERNGSRLTGCRIAGEDVEVEVSRPVEILRVGTLTAVARARAGPVDGGGAMS